MSHTPKAWTEALFFLAKLKNDDELPADFNVYAITIRANLLRIPMDIDTKMIYKHKPIRRQGIDMCACGRASVAGRFPLSSFDC